MNISKPHRLLFNLIAAIFIFFVFYNNSFGSGVYGVPIPVENCDEGVSVYKAGAACWWDSSSASSGRALFYGPSKIGAPGTNYMGTGFDTSYVPYAGLYKMRLHACASDSAGNCTLAESTEHFDGLRSVQLNSSTLLVQQNPNFGGGDGVLSTSSRLCVTFVSPDGSEWKTGAMRTCQDALALPQVPAFCYLNMGQDFNVDLGTMERGTIATVPGSSTKKNVALKVMCSGDASLTATLTLQYTPITIVGSEVVGSSINGVGVALFINDKLMSPADSLDMNFSAGVTEINLGFEVVRDPYVNIGDIGTGDFTADAVLVLTKQ